ncbi:hypothetical protein [Vibrio alginolyticus]|uniref:Uncharacterized protein n=1 Tax=Vibrio alginolyticus TaxID=663 RepID=A0A7Y4AYJ3_VIBAL|nr:hypothetical protein [Vibrio alginolyticus]NOI07374.1 hypothetical protein [Vibrio alginolyticus]
MKTYLVFILSMVGLPVFGSLGIGGVILGIAIAVLMMKVITQRSTSNKNSQDNSGLLVENDKLRKKNQPSLVGIRSKPQRSFFGSTQPSSRVSHIALSSERNTKPCFDIDIAIAVLNGARVEKITRKARTLKMAKREQVFRYLQQKEALRKEQNDWLSGDDEINDDHLNDPTHPLYPWGHQIEPFNELHFGDSDLKGSTLLSEDDYYTRSDSDMSLDYAYDAYGNSGIDSIDDSYLECDESCFDNDDLIEDTFDLVDSEDFSEVAEWFDAVDSEAIDDLEITNWDDFYSMK